MPSYRTDHYAFCKNRECTGCLLTDEELANFHVLALWGEMNQRCIAQTPHTKSVAGALAAIVEDGPSYRANAKRIREEHFADQKD